MDGVPFAFSACQNPGVDPAIEFWPLRRVAKINNCKAIETERAAERCDTSEPSGFVSNVIGRTALSNFYVPKFAGRFGDRPTVADLFSIEPLTANFPSG